MGTISEFKNYKGVKPGVVRLHDSRGAGINLKDLPVEVDLLLEQRDYLLQLHANKELSFKNQRHKDYCDGLINFLDGILDRLEGF